MNPLTCNPDSPETSGNLLAYLGDLLKEEPTESLEGILDGLARAFSVEGAGLLFPLRARLQLSRVCWLAPAAAEFPWEKQPEVLEQAERTADAFALASDDGSWLLTTMSQSNAAVWLLWVKGETGRVWTADDKGLLAVAGQCLLRLLLRHPEVLPFQEAVKRAQLQDRIEGVAAVTTRLAHDFGNILTGILGFAELSLPQLKPDTLPQRYVAEVLESARQGARWLHKLQLFGRRFRPKHVPTALAQVLEEEINNPHWGHGAVLATDVPTDLPDVAIDADSLRHVLTALLDNAREAVQGRGVVKLSAGLVELRVADCAELFGNCRPGEHLELVVSDNGPGLSAAVQERLFREFFTSTKGRRRGLGLPVVYGILHTYQGGLRLVSDPGQGTCVRVYLPLAQGADRAVPPPALLATRARLLVVDDDPKVLPVLAKTLEGAGYRVRSASGPEQAMIEVTQTREPFHLVVTDIVMDNETGLAMARRMLERDPQARFLFISSQAHQDLLLSRFPFLSKPFDSATLIQAVQAALPQLTASRSP